MRHIKLYSIIILVIELIITNFIFEYKRLKTWNTFVIEQFKSALLFQSSAVCLESFHRTLHIKRAALEGTTSTTTNRQ